MKFLALLHLFFVHWIAIGYSEDIITVNIPSLGEIRGSFMSSASGRQFSSFRGIPYAKPPIGPLRFKDPVAAEPWKGQVLDATKEGPKCVQSFISEQTIGVEDCLILNICTHDPSPSSRLRPVMVWIHGGGFMSGSGNGEDDFYGPGYLLDQDIVLVTINYRLGALGFFTTEDSEAPGNYGMLDQSLALRWVRNHIQHFGGDSKSVTIFGESAGGASVQYHILSPRSKGLFDRAIAQSGSSICPLALKKVGVQHYSKLLAQDLNCPLSPSRELMACLREKNATEFIDFVPTKQELNFFPLAMFQPRVDSERPDPFLPDEPIKLIKNKKFNAVPFITGVTQNEGALFVFPLVGQMELVESDPTKYLSYILDMELEENRKQITEKIISQYLDRERKFDDQLIAFEQIISDHAFNKWVDLSAHLYSRISGQPTFYYNYAHRGEYSFEKVLGAPPDFDLGVSHGDELFVMFSNKMFPAISRPGDLKVSKMLIDLWTSFATNGVPRSDLIADSWLQLDPNVETRYLNIEAENPKMINQPMPFHHRMPFWDTLFDSPKKDEL